MPAVKLPKQKRSEVSGGTCTANAVAVLFVQKREREKEKEKMGQNEGI